MGYYDELGVRKEATTEEIKEAYRRKAHETHPDRDGGDSDRFIAVQEAYDVLSNPDLKEEYDKTGRKQGAHPRVSVEDRAREYVVSVIFAIIDKTENVSTMDLMQQLRSHVSKDKASALNAVQAGKKVQNKLRSAADRMRDGEGGFATKAMLHQANLLDDKIKKSTEYIEKLESVESLIETLDYDFVKPQPSMYPYPSTVSYATSATT